MLRFVISGFASASAALAVIAATSMPEAVQAWEPTKPVEFIVPAGTGGGADQVARFVQGVAAKHNLMKQPLAVINKPGGAGAEGFLEIHPIEAGAQWRAGPPRPLYLFDAKRSTYTDKVTKNLAWSDIPTCKETGINVEYPMLRGVFGPLNISKEQVAFYVDPLKKVAATDDWKDYMEKGAYNSTMMTGDQFVGRLDGAEKTHRELMAEAGFLAKKVNNGWPTRTGVRVGPPPQPARNDERSQRADQQRAPVLSVSASWRSWWRSSFSPPAAW